MATAAPWPWFMGAAAKLPSSQRAAQLLQRLAAFEIDIPPLRTRRDDVGRLFAQFLQSELQATGELERLEPLFAQLFEPLF